MTLWYDLPMPRRRQALGVAPTGCWVRRTQNPSLQEIRKALTDPQVEAAYYADADLLVYGDENCVRLPMERAMGENRFIAHNHPIGSEPLPSNGDYCHAGALGTRRMDIVGFTPVEMTPLGPLMAHVVTTIANHRRDGRWPCSRELSPHAPALRFQHEGEAEVHQVPVAHYPLFRSKSFPERWYRRRGLYREAAEEKAPTESRFSKLEIDGALRRRRRWYR